MYSDLQDRLEDIIRGEINFMANASNFASLMFHGLKDVNWIGFFLYTGDDLILGPFQGKPACNRLPYGKGVCGTAAKLQKTIIVEDVHKYPGYIPCDPSANSELAIPIIQRKVLYGVLDLNSIQLSRFREDDESGINKLLNTLLDNSDMTSISKYYLQKV
jgi:GAF domain-containing protein